jgi:NADH-quinone oxidoreductase subunit N
MADFSFIALAPLMPELFLAIAAMILLIVGVMRADGGTKIVNILAMLIFINAAALVWCVRGDSGAILNGFFVLDRFAVFIKMLVLGGMVTVMALSLRYNRVEQMERFEYPVLLMFATLGMMLMISANNLLSLYMSLELQSLSFYVLAAFRRDDARASEAGLKYFILGALSSGMLLFGISYIYGYTGGVGYAEIAAALKGNKPDPGLTVGLVFVLVGLAFKISAVPFHMWTPDVYEGAPTSVTALFAIVPKVATLALITRLLYDPFLPLLPQWQQVVWFLAAASMTWGAFAALAQTNIKRLIAYSAIGNMGYALIGVAAGTRDGITAVIVYMTIYMVMTAGVFGVILAMRRKGKAVEEIESLAGLSRNDPFMAYAMAFFMFSLSGIPPLAGFFGKLVIFQSAIAAGMPVLAVLGVLASVVAAYYYVRIIKIMFFDEPAESFDRASDPGLHAVITLSAAFILLFILSPGFLIAASRGAALTFLTVAHG